MEHGSGGEGYCSDGQQCVVTDLEETSEHNGGDHLGRRKVIRQWSVPVGSFAAVSVSLDSLGLRVG